MKTLFAFVLVLFVLGAVSLFLIRSNAGNPAPAARSAGAVSTPHAQVSESERTEAFHKAIDSGRTDSADWPATPEALIREFWSAASRRNYHRLLALCPGSTVEDFKSYYDQWVPSPARAIGRPERYPRNPSVVLYPVTVDFPGFPSKTVKMALRKLDDGRLVIDGGATIWW